MSAEIVVTIVGAALILGPIGDALLRLNLMNTIQTGPVGEETANIAVADIPVWMENWKTTGLLDWEDKNGDGRIQYYNDGNAEFAAKAEAWGWNGNEMVTVDREILDLDATVECRDIDGDEVTLVGSTIDGFEVGELIPQGIELLFDFFIGDDRCLDLDGAVLLLDVEHVGGDPHHPAGKLAAAVGVDRHPRQNRLPPGLALHDHPAHPVPVPIGPPGVVQQPLGEPVLEGRSRQQRDPVAEGGPQHPARGERESRSA